MASDTCPVCGSTLPHPPPAPTSLTFRFDCPNCGPCWLTHSMLRVLEDQSKTSRQRAVLSHAIRRMQRDGEVPTIKTDLAERIWREDRLPTIVEQFDNLVMHLGANLSEP